MGQAGDDLRQIRISTEKVTRRGERISEVEMGEAVEGNSDLREPNPPLVDEN